MFQDVPRHRSAMSRDITTAPPVGFEPTHPAPEAGALSPELRGRTTDGRPGLASPLMDGVHDLGGRDGMGPVVVEHDEPVYHEAWERRVFGLAGAALGAAGAGTPVFRHGIERMRPAHFFAASYYERWLTSLATVLVERG